MTTFISKKVHQATKQAPGTVYIPPLAPAGRQLGASLEPRELFAEHEKSDFAKFVDNGAWKGRRCFIVGGGPSLKTFDWSLLDGELSIAINRAFEFYDPSVTISMDNRFFTWLQMGKANSTCEYRPEITERFWKQQCMKIWVQISKRPFPKGIYTLFNGGQKGFTRLMSDGVSTGENSGFAALNLAVNLGANPIYLLGYDMKGGKDGRQAHFHGGYMEQQLATIYKNKFMPYFENIAPELKERGFEIINLSADSAMECFEKQEFPQRSKSPVVVSFFTEDTGYETEAHLLMRSCVKHGMPFDIRPLPNRGNWEENCSMKPGFILEMMGKYPDRPIIWLDADATLEQRPQLFEHIGPGVDFACCHTTFIREVGAQLATGVLYFAPTPKAKDLVVRWNYQCLKDRKTWDQAHMQHMVICWDGKTMMLPNSYCHMFDNQNIPVGGVVIMQHQASRRLRDLPRPAERPPAVADQPSAIAEGDELAFLEKDRYANLWANEGYRPSQTQGMIVDSLMKGGFTQGDILEFGCGNGAAVETLKNHGLNAQGMDITLAGLLEKRNGHYTEAALWDMPFEDDEFDMTFSTDVLEHLPPGKAEESIKEILRVTKRITVHVIANFSCKMYGQELHSIQETVEWWREKFESCAPECKVLLVDRKDFMKTRLK